MSPLIESVTAQQRFDSRGNPTVQATVEAKGMVGSALVPSGASTGIFEALELRDGGVGYMGKGVTKAVDNVQKIAEVIASIDVFDQQAIDQAMIDLDGTENKSNLGANAILSVSLAIPRLAAEIKGIPLFRYLAETYGNKEPVVLPTPMMNVLNGGAHAGWEGTDFQEFMIVPIGADSFAEAMQMGTETYHNLKALLKKKGFPTQVGDEGGFVPKLKSNEQAIELILEAVLKAGYKPGEQIAIALDPAASEIFEEKSGQYNLKTENRILSTDEMIELWQSWIEKYPIVSLEDGLAQNDWLGWQKMTKSLGNKVQLVGDDLLVTNPKRVSQAIEEKVANALLVKLNQIGTLTETVAAIKLCEAAGWNTVVSHRSGETEDAFIADLAVALNMGQIKTGAPARSERMSKYNRLLDIEEIHIPQAGLKADYAGGRPFISSNVPFD